MATAPFIDFMNLVKAKELLLSKNNVDSVYPLVEFHYPILRSLKIDGKYVRRAFPEFATARSQDMESFYHDAAQFYFFKLSAYNRKSFILDKTVPIIIPEKATHDIDTIEDWEIAEFKYNFFKERNA
jgi:N-acylneuraminate cytidylyltransferase